MLSQNKNNMKQVSRTACSFGDLRRNPFVALADLEGALKLDPSNKAVIRDRKTVQKLLRSKTK